MSFNEYQINQVTNKLVGAVAIIAAAFVLFALVTSASSCQVQDNNGYYQVQQQAIKSGLCQSASNGETSTRTGYRWTTCDKTK